MAGSIRDSSPATPSGRSSTHPQQPSDQTSEQANVLPLQREQMRANAGAGDSTPSQQRRAMLQRTFGNLRLQRMASGSSAVDPALMQSSREGIVNRAERHGLQRKSKVPVTLRDDSRGDRLQRHNMPMPNALKPTQLRGPKQQWSAVAGPNPVISDPEMDMIRMSVQAMIPPFVQPSPAERVGDVEVITVSTMGMPQGYQQAQIPAKTDDQGYIWVNWECLDYFKPSGEPDPEKIKSTIVHEFMHAVSADHKGLQDYATLLSPQGGIADSRHQPDEAITDMLAVRVYEQVFGAQSPYRTGYWVQPSGSVQAHTDGEKKKLQAQNQLPGAWTGDMVEVLTKVLGVSEQFLIRAYFDDPEMFGTMLGQLSPTDPIDPQIKTRIIDAWNAKIGEKTFENQEVLTMGPQGFNYKEQFLYDLVTLPLAKQLVAAADDPAKIAIMRKALTAKKVPLHATPGTLGPTQYTYTDAFFSAQRLTRIIQIAAQLVGNPPPNTDPWVKIAGPAEQAVIPGGMVSVNVDASPVINNVRVNFENRGWTQTFKNGNRWMTQFNTQGIQTPAEAAMEVEGWTEQGVRVTENRTINIGARPPLKDGPAIDRGLVDAHLRTLGVPGDRVKIIVVPFSKPSPANPANRVTFKLNTALSEYPDDYLYHVPNNERNQSVADLLHLPAAVAQSPAAQYINTNFNGGGYDADAKLVVLAADHNQPRTLLHELGHFRQDLEGAHEHNAYVMVLEYHNVLIHENLDPKELRTSYGSPVPATPHGQTWNTLLADAADHPQTIRLLNEIENVLHTPRYAAMEAEIKDNLVAEYFTDQKGDRAHKKANLPAAGPMPTIDHPQPNENLAGDHFAVRVSVPANANNVRIKINQKPFEQARLDQGFWWLNINPQDFPTGKMSIMAEAWDVTGARGEVITTVTRV